VQPLSARLGPDLPLAAWRGVGACIRRDRLVDARRVV
jgi:hypothetical protein